MKKHKLDVILIAAAALFLAFTVGFYAGRHTVRGITVATEATLQLPAIFDEYPAENVDDFALAEASIDLNTANQLQLEMLPGVGPTLAKRIIAYREETGGFTTTEELMEVYGIGEHTYAEIKPYITVNR